MIPENYGWQFKNYFNFQITQLLYKAKFLKWSYFKIFLLLIKYFDIVYSRKRIRWPPFLTISRIFDLAYNEIFKENFYIADGEAIKNNPDKEFAALLKFFDLENPLAYKFRREKGFFCLDKPVKYCLPGEKGLTRNKNISSSDGSFDNLKFFYKESMKNTMLFVNHCQNVSECCMKKWLRFDWLKTYACTEIY